MNRTLALILLLMLLPSILYQQEKQEPFSSINIGGGLLVNSNRNLLHKFWKPEKGFYINAESPFYFGEISFGLFFLQFKNLNNVPSYKNYFIHAGWAKEISLPLNISITNGIRVGTDIMDFQNTSLSEYQRIESEFAVSIFSKINCEIIRGISISVTGDLQNIYTNRRIKLVYILGGLNYRFSSPVWLRDFLK